MQIDSVQRHAVRPVRLSAAGTCAVALLCVLSACGPIPVEQAERQCLDEARAATGPRGEVSMGVGSNGHRSFTHTGVSVSVSSDWLMGKPPAEVFNRCVMQRAGRLPSRPLQDQPGWSR